MESHKKQFRVLPMAPDSPASEELLATKELILVAPKAGTITVLANNVPGVAEVTLHVELHDERYITDRLEVRPPPGEDVNLEEIRSARELSKWRAAAIASSIWARLPDGRVFDAAHPVEGPDPVLSLVMRYTVAKALGENPVVAVAEDLGISMEVARGRVYRAREKGFLPPATRRGKA